MWRKCAICSAICCCVRLPIHSTICAGRCGGVSTRRSPSITITNVASRDRYISNCSTSLQPVADQYSNYGVHFSSATILTHGASLAPNYIPKSGDNVVYDSPTGSVTARFDAAQSEVGGYITGNVAVTMRAYNTNGELVGQASTPGANYIGSETGLPPNIWLGVASEKNDIVRIVFSDHGNSFTLDDFTFQQSAEHSFKLYYGNLHSHTQFSDGGYFSFLHPEELSPQTAYRFAQDQRQGQESVVMAVTDHGEQIHNDAWMLTKTYAAQATGDRFVALRGFEWTHTFSDVDGVITWATHLFTPFATGEGHINVFNSLDYVGAHQGTSDSITVLDTLPQLYQWVAANKYNTLDGKALIAQFNHPSTYDNSSHFQNLAIPDYFPAGKQQAILSTFALMELGAHNDNFIQLGYESGEGPFFWNTYSPDVSNEYWFRLALKKGWHVAPTNNEDNHIGSYGQSPHRTGIYAQDTQGFPPDKAQSVILDALRARRVFSSEDRNSTLYIQARVGGEKVWHWMGEAIEVPTGSDLAVYFNTTDERDSLFADDDTIKSVEVIAVSAISPYGNVVVTRLPGRVQRSSFSDIVVLASDALSQLPTTERGEICLYVKVRQNDGDLLYSAPLWITRTPPQLTLTPTLSRNGSQVDMDVALTNSGTSDISDVVLKSASLGSVIAVSGLPQTLGTIPAGTTKHATVHFGTAGAPRTKAVLRLAGTYAGGTFGANLRVVLP